MNRRGLTLIELLVALVISALVAYMAWDLLTDEHVHYTRTRTKIRLQSDAKEAMRIIEGEMRNMGFNMFLDGTNGLNHTTVEPCTGTQDARINPAGGDSSAFTFVNSDAVPGGDQIEFRFHQSSASGMTNCADASTPLQSISYRFNAGRLERRYCQGSAVATCSTNGEWVPFLDSVVSFHILYGLDADTSEVVYSTDQLLTTTNWNSSGGLTVTPAPVAGSDTTWTVAGFASAMKYARFNLAPTRHRKTDTYLLSFRAVMNEAWRVDGSRFLAGFVKSNGTLDAASDTARVTVGPNILGSEGPLYQLLLTPSVDADGLRFLGFSGQLVTTPSGAAGPSIVLRDLSLRRLSRGQYFKWVSQPLVAEKKRVHAIRVSLLVKSLRSDADPAPGTFSGVPLGDTGLTYTPPRGYSYILMQRIIPVVNNAAL